MFALPYRQLAEGCIAFIYPAIAIRIQPGQIGKSIAAPHTKQFRTIIGPAIAVTVENEIGTPGGRTRHLDQATLPLEIEGKTLAA